MRVEKLLCKLGHEPTVIALGGHARTNTAFDSYSLGNGCWETLSDGGRWNLAEQLTLNKKWLRNCVRDAGLNYTRAGVHLLVDELKDPDRRQRLIEQLVPQRERFLKELRNSPEWVERNPNKLIPENPADAQKLRFLTLAKACKKIHRAQLQQYVAHVDLAKQRKADWLRPLMWEALGYIQARRFSVRLKRDFYKRAKNTVCFDCDRQEQDRSLMTFDHLRHKRFTLGDVDFDRIHWRKLHMEIGKCDVVCRSCHDIREYLRGVHGFTWENLTPEQQARIAAMPYVERQLYYQVINRETKQFPKIDAYSLRLIKKTWDRTKSQHAILQESL